MSFNSNIIIVGIAGCSRSGKTVLVKELINQYSSINKQNSFFCDIYDVIHLDTYANYNKVMKSQFKTSRGNIYPNWEFTGSLDWDIFYRDIQNKIKEMNSKIKNSQNFNKKGILFIEGFLLFSPLLSNNMEENIYLNLFDYYIFISLDKNIAKERRMKTTTVPNDYYEEILWPEYIKNCSKYIDFFNFQKFKNNKNVLVIDGNKEYILRNLALCIFKWMNLLGNNYYVDNNVYNDIFVPFDNQINLIKKSLSSR